MLVLERVGAHPAFHLLEANNKLWQIGHFLVPEGVEYSEFEVKQLFEGLTQLFEGCEQIKVLLGVLLDGLAIH